MSDSSNVDYNHLKDEKSPYLLQHATNPVDWYPWSEEAFERARDEDKPIFLSIGYSTCHWCHVMEEESFEDEEVARLMNENFVNIKVDREERPDIDSLYITVSQLVTGRAGWPLTIIMTPDKKPFFTGTYIPKETRQGQMGMLDLIQRTKSLWENRRDELLNSADEITLALSKTTEFTKGVNPDRKTLDLTYKQLTKNYDELYGGFGENMKFPTPHNHLFLLRYWRRTGDHKALTMVEETLRNMRRGGIYDHIGYGFHRYSTDREWILPHFEKMLYDQALICLSYTEAYQATGTEEFKETAEQIFEYVLRDMTSPEGGFYSAEDADTEGVEGKFYTWTEDEIKEVLNEKDADLFLEVYNIEKDGNFKEEATGKKTGENIIYLKKPLSEIANEKDFSESELKTILEKIRKQLFSVREKRVHPHKDDKILTDWNGLMIASLARAGVVLDNEEYISSAEKAVQFILSEVRTGDGGLLHRYREGEPAITATLDDYAFLIWGLLELYEATFKVEYLRTSIELMEYAIRHFRDEEEGGFFLTSDDEDELLIRQKEIYDGALPSGNSVMVLNLVRLSRITGDTDYEEKAQEIGKVFSSVVKQAPVGFTQLMVGTDFLLGPSYELIIVGDPDGDDTKKMLNKLRSEYIPNRVLLLKPLGNSEGIEGIVDYISDYDAIEGKATAYVCSNFTCQQPTTDVDEMMELLGD